MPATTDPPASATGVRSAGGIHAIVFSHNRGCNKLWQGVYDHESIVLLEAQIVELDGVSVRVATPRTLVRMKQWTVRPIDRQDARALIEAFGLAEDDDAG